ncbi:MAG: putative Ig domain-containing protein [Terriglobales bacterium]
MKRGQQSTILNRPSAIQSSMPIDAIRSYYASDHSAARPTYRGVVQRTIWFIAIFLLSASAALGQQPAGSEPLPDAFIHVAYYQQLHPPQQGTAPWRWRVIGGSLPPGISLEPNGVIGGAATLPGQYRFTLEARDSSPKPVAKSREYVITVPPPLRVVWTEAPHVTDNGAITGKIEVFNGTGRTMDLTVIIVAVNTFNKAFALGYQHFSFGAGSQQIPFGSTLPRDSYIVHGDAVGEIAETYEIYRARLQTGAVSVP